MQTAELVEEDFEWEERETSTPLNIHLLAGSLAGIAEHTFILPLDNIKTHIQKTGASTSQVFRTLRSHGYQNFYQGAGIISLGCIPSHALFFASYEISKKYFTREGQIDVFGNAMVGGFSVIFHDMIMTPCELIKQRMQLLKESSAMKVARDFRKSFGLKAFWRSFPVNFMSNLPHSMVTVSANETFKVMYSRWVAEHSMWSYFMCGSLAGCVSALVTSPLDNVKTQLNCESVDHTSISSLKEQYRKAQILAARPSELTYNLRRTYFNQMVKQISCVCSNTEKKLMKNLKRDRLPPTVCAMKKIMYEKGIKGFFRGLGLRMIMQSSSTAVSWTVYEFMKKRLAFNTLR